MKKFMLLLFVIATFIGCNDSGGGDTPFIPVSTFPVKVDIASYSLPAESNNWKYAVSDNTSSDGRNYRARASYIVERLGKSNGSDSPNAYIRVSGANNTFSKFDSWIYIYIYSASKDKLLYYAELGPAKDDSPATLYNSIVEFAIDSIKNYPQDSFSGVVELPY